ncbi:MAG: M48 family metalloprotease [Ilumatobacteraceae bacterium]|nr:M48 family metalloprotease [Ilumatobacteraceae bacterium]
MAGFLAFPLLVSLAIAAVATSAHRRLPPRLATRFVTIALVLVVVGALPTALVVAVAFLAHVPVIGVGFQWCAQVMGLHASVPAWLGIPIVALIVIGTVRSFRLLRQHRALRLHDAHPIHIAHSRKPYAVTLPGRAGQIVISTAMVELLDDDERRIVIAHEEAHARYRHDRYLLTAELAAAALPPLRALARRVTYSIERWADEAAATACGDRQLVAVTLGKGALQANLPTVAGFSGLGVASRMGALLEPPIPMPRRAQVVVLWSSLAITAAFSLYQLHHLERLLTALCPH